MLAWISVEMGLTRIWLQFLKNKGFSVEKRTSLSRWDVSFIIETLSMLGMITSQMKNDLDCLRELRNDVVHGTLIYPNKGQILRCIMLGRALIPVLQQ